jgi:hypothetical protein
MLKLVAIDRTHVLAVDERGEPVLLDNDLVNRGCCCAQDHKFRPDGPVLIPIKGTPPLTWMADDRLRNKYYN